MKQKSQLLRRITLVLTLLLLAGSLIGCESRHGTSLSDIPSATSSSATTDSSQPGDTEQPDVENESDFPGSYTVPDGWVKMEKYSTEDKIFYAEEGHEEDELPDNISIEVKPNRYSAEDHMKFRDAIVRQLTIQASGAGAELTGEGTFTDQEDILYIFTISEEDVVTKQFYIVGDKRYCLIHLTNFTGSESADEAAQAMASSFVWD